MSSCRFPTDISSWPCRSSSGPYSIATAVLKRLCTVAQQTITTVLRAALGFPKGRPAFFLALHTFGEYLDFHPHIHALVGDGLLAENGDWQPAPEIPRHVLEELFRTRIFAELHASNSSLLNSLPA